MRHQPLSPSVGFFAEMYALLVGLFLVAFAGNFGVASGENIAQLAEWENFENLGTMRKRDVKASACLFCPGGLSAIKVDKPGVDRSNVKNGCGPSSKQYLATVANTFVVTKVKKCCDEHDLCFTQCDKTFSDCQREFSQCLKKADKKKKKKCPWYNPVCHVVKYVKKAAQLFDELTDIHGCKFYKITQNEFCQCPNSTTPEQESEIPSMIESVILDEVF